MLVLNKVILIACLSLLLTACNARVEAMKETIAYSIYGAPDVELSEAEIANLKYASQYVKLKEQPRAMVVLGFDDNNDYHWLSGENEVIVTRYGRLIRTTGLAKDSSNVHYDIRHVKNTDSDPLVCWVQQSNYQSCPKTWSTEVEVGNGSQAKRYALKTTIINTTEDTITLQNGEQVNAIKVVESATATSSNKTHQFKNIFWLDKTKQRVLKSEQGLVPGFPFVKMEELKPYPKDLKVRQ